MGGSISNENVRINLLMTSELKNRISYYSSNLNRSSNSVVVQILEDTLQKKNLPDHFDGGSDPNQRKTARMNLVVSKDLKEKLSAEAKEKDRSLNYYICTKLLIFFDMLWPDSL